MFKKPTIKLRNSQESSRFLIQKTWKKYLLLLIIIFLQIAFISHPNLVLFYVLISQSIFMGFLGGFILDLYSPWPFGINMLAFMALILIFNYLSKKYIRPGLIYYLIIGLISIVYNFLFLAIF